MRGYVAEGVPWGKMSQIAPITSLPHSGEEGGNFSFVFSWFFLILYFLFLWSEGEIGEGWHLSIYGTFRQDFSNAFKLQKLQNKSRGIGLNPAGGNQPLGQDSMTLNSWMSVHMCCDVVYTCSCKRCWQDPDFITADWGFKLITLTWDSLLFGIALWKKLLIFGWLR